MNSVRAAKLALAVGLAALCGFITSDGLARPKPPVVEAPPPPPPPPPMPAVSMASRLVAQAAAFDTYTRLATAISPAFTDPGSVASSLKTGVAYEPAQFRHGEVAYGAIAALSDSTFVAAVRAAGATPEGRYAIVRRIFEDPSNALQFADGRVAAGIAKQALIGVGRRLYDSGGAVKQAAYDIQHQKWSLTDVADRDQREATVKSLSSTPRGVSYEESNAMRALVTGMQPQGALAPAPGPYPTIVVHAVALAALAAIGEAGDDAVSRVDWLMDDYYTDHCLAEAKLSLYECLAVARPNYEDVFCLGQHAMRDTGACMVKGAGGTVPLEILTRPISVAPAHIGAHRPATRRHH
jgi:hypothetical protein